MDATRKVRLIYVVQLILPGATVQTTDGAMKSPHYRNPISKRPRMYRGISGKVSDT